MIFWDSVIIVIATKSFQRWGSFQRWWMQPVLSAGLVACFVGGCAPRLSLQSQPTLMVAEAPNAPLSLRLIKELYNGDLLMVHGTISGSEGWERGDVRVRLRLYRDGELLTAVERALGDVEGQDGSGLGGIPAGVEVPFHLEVSTVATNATGFTDYQLELVWDNGSDEAQGRVGSRAGADTNSAGAEALSHYGVGRSDVPLSKEGSFNTPGSESPLGALNGPGSAYGPGSVNSPESANGPAPINGSGAVVARRQGGAMGPAPKAGEALSVTGLTSQTITDGCSASICGLHLRGELGNQSEQIVKDVALVAGYRRKELSSLRAPIIAIQEELSLPDVNLGPGEVQPFEVEFEKVESLFEEILRGNLEPFVEIK